MISKDLNKVNRDLFDVPLCRPNDWIGQPSTMFSQELWDDTKKAFAQYLKPLRRYDVGQVAIKVFMMIKPRYTHCPQIDTQ